MSSTLRSRDVVAGQYHVNDLYVNIILAAVVAGVVAWILHVSLYPRLRTRLNHRLLRGLGALMSAGAGVYTGLVLAFPGALNVMLSPAIGLLAALTLLWVLHRAYRQMRSQAASAAAFYALATVPAAAVGAFCGFLVADAPGTNLYLSWVVSCLLAGCVGMALYRGLYVHMRQRAPLPPHHACRLPRRHPDHHSPHHPRLSKHAAPSPRSLRQHPMDHCRGKHQGVQPLHRRRRPRGLRGPPSPSQAGPHSESPYAPSATTKRCPRSSG